MEKKFEDFVKLVEEMRQLQKEYFSPKRKFDTLPNAIAKEKEVDSFIKATKAPAVQTDIFNQKT